MRKAKKAQESHHSRRNNAKAAPRVGDANASRLRPLLFAEARTMTTLNQATCRERQAQTQWSEVLAPAQRASAQSRPTAAHARESALALSLPF
jgi:hypothetical protein